jgi:hypothetical protein
MLMGNSILYHSALYSLATTASENNPQKKKGPKYNAEENIWTQENGINGRKGTSE